MLPPSLVEPLNKNKKITRRNHLLVRIYYKNENRTPSAYDTMRVSLSVRFKFWQRNIIHIDFVLDR